MKVFLLASVLIVFSYGSLHAMELEDQEIKKRKETFDVIAFCQSKGFTLTSFDLSESSLNNFQFRCLLDNLKDLETINVSHNNITQIPCGIGKYKKVNLSYNQIATFYYDVSWPTEELNLSYNPLKKVSISQPSGRCFKFKKEQYPIIKVNNTLLKDCFIKSICNEYARRAYDGKIQGYIGSCIVCAGVCGGLLTAALAAYFGETPYTCTSVYTRYAGDEECPVPRFCQEAGSMGYVAIPSQVSLDKDFFKLSISSGLSGFLSVGLLTDLFLKKWYYKDQLDKAKSDAEEKALSNVITEIL